MTGVVVKVTEVPAQTVVAVAAIVTLTGRIGFTVMFRAVEIAGFPEVQVSLEVSVQVTSLPFAGTNAYVALVAPDMLVPFTFH